MILINYELDKNAIGIGCRQIRQRGNHERICTENQGRWKRQQSHINTAKI